jgi:hypothetical protein
MVSAYRKRDTVSVHRTLQLLLCTSDYQTNPISPRGNRYKPDREGDKTIMETAEVATIIMRRIAAACKDAIEREAAFSKDFKSTNDKEICENRIYAVSLLTKKITRLLELYYEIMTE